MSDNYPDNFLIQNQQSSKNLAVVVEIDGLDDLISSVQLYTLVRYGDPGIFYGDGVTFYGGLRALTNVKPYLNLDGGMTIGQKIEPEQGRGAITLLSLSFTDKDAYFSQLISPGVVLDDVLGNKFVKVYLGYQNTSFPEDFVIILRGYVSGTTYSPSKVTLQISDPNIKRKATVCQTNKTTLTSSIGSGNTTIPVVGTGGLYDQILGPDGTYDPAVKTYLKIGDEFMEYGPGAISPTDVVVTRGSRSTTAVSHAFGDEVTNVIQIQENVINIALKLMLSGWNGPFLSDVVPRSYVDTQDPLLGDVPNSILLPVNKDAIQDFGLNVGDWVTVSGNAAGNDGGYQIQSISESVDRPNRLLVVDGPLNYESPATGVIAFRSQFDTLPMLCGGHMFPYEVDVAQHVLQRNQYLSQNENRMRFLLFDSFNLKQFIENELFLPIGAYSLTRFGRVSLTLTKPPIADQKLIVLDDTNIVDASSHTVTRALNTRRYFSEIDYSYDLADDNTTFQTNLNFLDSTSLSKITISSVLPITSNGMKTDLGASTLINRRALFLSRRYNNAAFELKLKTNFEIISQLEAGDIVSVKDNGTLKILNLSNGTRNIGEQLFEVIDRQLDIKSAQGSITLLSNIGVQITDRFATISPSSLVTGGTVDNVLITESFGAFFPGAEQNKWKPYVGLPIFIHNADYSIVSSEVTFTSVDPGNNHSLLVSPSLDVVPTAGMIVEIGKYPETDTDPSTNQLYKVVHAYFDPSVAIVTGIDNFNFTVSLTDVTKFNIGLPVLIHDVTYSIMSPESLVTVIDTGTGQITVDTDLTFTPAAGQTAELIGFADFGGPYRLI